MVEGVVSLHPELHDKPISDRHVLEQSGIEVGALPACMTFGGPALWA
jgi:hypothetical protein